MPRMQLMPIKLSPELKRKAQRKAASRQVSLSAYVRGLIAGDVEQDADTMANPFTGIQAFPGPMPPHGASDLDRYLKPRTDRR
ncbi:MAG: hypothetical protein HC898_06045 [Phycisphaerales bacterium]|nr:hypothetical protein [Phycisphaerales bacterium]